MDARRQLDVTLVRGVGIVALYAGISGVVRLAQDILIASRFGVGPTVDAYYFLLSLVNWPVAVALATLTAVVAPREAILRRAGTPSANVFRAELLGRILLVAFAALPLAWWTVDAIAGSAIGGLGLDARTRASTSVAALIAIVPLGILGALFSAWFVATSKHSLTLVEALPPVVLILAITTLTEPALFWGTTAGIAAQVIVMTWMLRRRADLPNPRLGASSTAWPGFWQGMVAMLAGQILFAFVPLVDAFFAARMDEGTMGTLSYANRLIIGLQGMIALALRRVGLPLLSRLSAQSPSESLATAARWAVAACVAGALLAAAVAAPAEILVALLFERGSFTAEDTEQVASLLRFGLLQMPFFLGGIPLVAALTSIQARRTLLLIPACGLISKLLLCSVFVPQLGAAGLQIATAVMYAVTSSLAVIALVRQRRRSASRPPIPDA